MKGKDQTEKLDISRRDFVKNGAVAAAAFTIVPRHVLGKGFRAPSDTLYIASVGVGGKGESDINGFMGSGKAKMAFLCDVDQSRGKRTFEKYPEAKRYVDWREMFDKEHKNFDAVSVSTPDHTHAVVGSASITLGKHTWIQKPLAHDVFEARLLAKLAKKHKVITQMGNQGSSNDGVRQMREWFDAGIIGDVQEVYCWTNRPVWPQGNNMKWPSKPGTAPADLNWDLWQGTAPAKPFPAMAAEGGIDLVPFNWRGWWDYGTGVLGDMGAHILEAPMSVLNLGYVSSVQTSVSGGGSLETGPASNYTIMTFPKTDKTKGPVRVHWMDGGMIPPRPEELDPAEAFGSGDGGMLFIGSKGKMTAGCYSARARLLPVSRMDEVNVPEKFARVTNGADGHYAQWVQACLDGYGKGVVSSPFEKAALLTEAMLMCNLAIRGVNVPKAAVAAPPATAGTGAATPGAGMRQRGPQFPARYINLNWDAANMKVTNVDEVNQFVKREYRAPWKPSGV
ncbi:Gfo/Idh/MocA family protein [Hufsiella ginkgonis]|uniref:Gfo/Idh/MocA family oxidoreductase n=1 Tax=Hufsiella ginkgonis TaxID=2695274 RepID=A0A7K1Y111_9SPHI|nr:Gfo/Idh/MocA family oxidoreductase [Hufsiella ginkgonis]MXV16356.1 Gfo/Idh/MocA family oxidoreductase [Hufsiella ginkgonis]